MSVATASQPARLALSLLVCCSRQPSAVYTTHHQEALCGAASQGTSMDTIRTAHGMQRPASPCHDAHQYQPTVTSIRLTKPANKSVAGWQSGKLPKHATSHGARACCLSVAATLRPPAKPLSPSSGATPRSRHTLPYIKCDLASHS